jgi:hypothetical protein
MAQGPASKRKLEFSYFNLGIIIEFFHEDNSFKRALQKKPDAGLILAMRPVYLYRFCVVN